MQAVEKQIFVRRGTRLPDQLRLPESAVGADWLALAENADELCKQVCAANWHFFYLTEQAQGWAIARGREKAGEAALRRALKKVNPSRNTAEVIDLQYTCRAGFYFCRVQLAVRHVQREMILPLAPAVGLISAAVKAEDWLRQPWNDPQEPLAA